MTHAYYGPHGIMLLAASILHQRIYQRRVAPGPKLIAAAAFTLRRPLEVENRGDEALERLGELQALRFRAAVAQILGDESEDLVHRKAAVALEVGTLHRRRRGRCPTAIAIKSWKPS